MSFGSTCSLYRLRYKKISSPKNLAEQIQSVLDTPGTVLCEVILDQNVGTAPHLSSKALPDGSMVSLPMENLAPFLPEDEFAQNMKF